MLEAIRKMIKTDPGLPAKKWLKSSEVRKMLDISQGKLHMLRASRKLAFMRLGGVIYYDREDIIKMFENSKTPVVKIQLADENSIKWLGETSSSKPETRRNLFHSERSL